MARYDVVPFGKALAADRANEQADELGRNLADHQRAEVAKESRAAARELSRQAGDRAGQGPNLGLGRHALRGVPVSNSHDPIPPDSPYGVDCRSSILARSGGGNRPWRPRNELQQ